MENSPDAIMEALEMVQEWAMEKLLADKAQGDWTSQIPLGRLGTVDEVAAAACFLASDEAAYITGHVLAVNGGMYT
jgi:3-oxoacyl-[acyl-carrier protein] reductase